MLCRAVADPSELIPEVGAPPVSLTGFIGRGHDIATIRRLLTAPGLLTLTGAAGSGRRRLAGEAVRDVRPPLAWLDVPALLGSAPMAIDDAFDGALASFAGAEAPVLVLAGCDGEPARCGELVAHALAAAPGLRAIATGTGALGVAGERTWVVPPLSARDAEALFVERALEVMPTFARTTANAGSVARTCELAGRLPLAIELAAARIGDSTPDQVCESLAAVVAREAGALPGPGVVVPRERTQRAAAAWSFAMLTVPERMLLERLTIFPADFTLEAATEVCQGGAVPRARVSELLGALVVRNFVGIREVRGFARYRLADPVRAFALERRAERPDTSALAERFARWDGNTRRGTPASRGGHPKSRALVALLRAHPDGRTRDQCCADLWPGLPPARARALFHQALSHTASTLPRAEIAWDGSRYRLTTPTVPPAPARELPVG